MGRGGGIEGRVLFLLDRVFRGEVRRAGTRVFVCENVYMTLNVACTSQGGGWMALRVGKSLLIHHSAKCGLFFYLYRGTLVVLPHWFV